MAAGERPPRGAGGDGGAVRGGGGGDGGRPGGDARALLAFRDAVGRHVAWNGSDPGGACSWTG